MCGRFTLFSKIEDLKEEFNLDSDFDVPPRYNIAPSQDIPIIIYNPETQKRELKMAGWGLIPFWAKDPNKAHKAINARSESLLEKPYFRVPYQKKRCLIPTSGFYEWVGDKPPKQPYFFHLDHKKLFAFAGLWDTWPHNQDTIMLQTTTIITTEANEFMKPYHDRMPVIIDKKDYDLWLKSDDEKDLLNLLKPKSIHDLQAQKVALFVNSPKEDTSRCIQPVQ